MLQSMNKAKKIASVLRAATERLNSVELWTARLRLYLNEGDDKMVNICDVFICPNTLYS
jgi:hypothetical protein